MLQLRRLFTKIEVTLAEHTPTYTALPMHVQITLTHPVQSCTIYIAT